MLKQRRTPAPKAGAASGAALMGKAVALDCPGAKVAATAKPQKATSLSKHLAKQVPHQQLPEDNGRSGPVAKRADAGTMSGAGGGVFWSSASQDNAAFKEQHIPVRQDGQFVFEDNRSRLGGPSAGLTAKQAATRVSAAGGIFIEDERNMKHGPAGPCQPPLLGSSGRSSAEDGERTQRTPRTAPLTGHGPHLDKPPVARHEYKNYQDNRSPAQGHPAALAEHAFNRMRHQQAPVNTNAMRNDDVRVADPQDKPTVAQGMPVGPVEHGLNHMRHQQAPVSTAALRKDEASMSPRGRMPAANTPRRVPGETSRSPDPGASFRAPSSRAKSEEPSGRGGKPAKGELRYKPKPYQHMKAVDMEKLPKSTPGGSNTEALVVAKPKAIRYVTPLRPGGGKDCNMQQKSVMMGAWVTAMEPETPRVRRCHSVDPKPRLCAFTDNTIAQFNGAAMKGVFDNYQTITDKDLEKELQAIPDQAAGNSSFIPKPGRKDPSYIQQLVADGVMPTYWDRNVTSRSLMKLRGPGQTRTSFARPGGHLVERLHTSTGDLGSAALSCDVPRGFGAFRSSDGVRGCLQNDFAGGGPEAEHEVTQEMRMLDMVKPGLAPPAGHKAMGYLAQPEATGQTVSGDPYWAHRRRPTSSARRSRSFTGPDKIETEKAGSRGIGGIRNKVNERWTQSSLDLTLTDTEEKRNIIEGRAMKGGGAFKDGPSLATAKQAAARDPEMFHFATGGSMQRSRSVPADSYDLVYSLSPGSTPLHTTRDMASTADLDITMLPARDFDEMSWHAGKCVCDAVNYEDGERAGLLSTRASRRGPGWERNEAGAQGRAHSREQNSSHDMAGILAGMHGAKATEAIHQYRLANECRYAQACADTHEAKSHTDFGTSIRQYMTTDKVKDALMWG